MARALTPTEFVDRPKAAPRHGRERHYSAAVRAALTRLAQALLHPRLRHVGH